MNKSLRYFSSMAAGLGLAVGCGIRKQDPYPLSEAHYEYRVHDDGLKILIEPYDTDSEIYNSLRNFSARNVGSFTPYLKIVNDSTNMEMIVDTSSFRYVDKLGEEWRQISGAEVIDIYQKSLDHAALMVFAFAISPVGAIAGSIVYEKENFPKQFNDAMFTSRANLFPGSSESGFLFFVPKDAPISKGESNKRVDGGRLSLEVKVGEEQRFYEFKTSKPFNWADRKVGSE